MLLKVLSGWHLTSFAKLEVEILKPWQLGPGTFGTFGAIRLMELSESALALKHWSSASCGL